MKVAGYQMCVSDEDVAENCRKILATVDEAAARGADILLTPEGSLSGYHNHFDRRAAAEALETVRARAREKGLGLALGTCFFEDDGRCYNQIRFYGKDGAYLGFHAKTLLCSNRLDEPYEGEITYFARKALEVFRFDGVTVGGLICNDLWANPGCTPMPDPHLSQQLARMGARVIFHAVNGGRGDPESIALNRAYHESNQRLRAAAARVFLVTVDNAFPLTKDNSCRAGVISPAGEYICSLPVRGEGLFVQEIL